VQPFSNSAFQHSARSIAVLCHELSGGGRALKMAGSISHLLTVEKVAHEVFINQWPPDFSSFTDIFLAGGDGSINYYLNHYDFNTLPLTIFNGGTGNDFHALLYGSQSVAELVNIGLNTAPRAFDVGVCNQRYFINGIGIGFEGAIAKALSNTKKWPGKLSYMATILSQILHYQTKKYRIDVDGNTVGSSNLMIDICNGARAGGGFRVAPLANAGDGWLDLIEVAAISPLRRLRYLPVIERGKHLSLSFVKHTLIQSVQIKSDEQIQYHMDGEYAEALQLEIKILPGVLPIRCL
jgi:diacylglycerol kinase (ATP)